MSEVQQKPKRASGAKQEVGRLSCRLSRNRWQDGMSIWLMYKDIRGYYAHLTLLNQVVGYLYKDFESINVQVALTQKIKERLPEEKHAVLDQLIHSSTVINHMQRVVNGLAYESTKEDVLNGAKLLQIHYNPESLLPVSSRLLYNQIACIFGSEQFSINDVRKRIYISKSSIKRHICALRNTSFIRHVKTGKNNTFYYRVV